MFGLLPVTWSCGGLSDPKAPAACRLAAVRNAESNGLEANGSSTSAAGLAVLVADAVGAPVIVGRMAAKTERGDSTAANGAEEGELPTVAAAEWVRGNITGEDGFSADETDALEIPVARANESMSPGGRHAADTMGDWRI
jgi:hypothetical protein